jgi:hypothetical protein
MVTPSTPDPVRVKNYYLKKTYDITLVEYDTMLAAQGGRCAICRRDNPGRKDAKYFAVDHCHTTSRVRKLLCLPCNAMIGLGQDDPSILEAGAAYLREHHGA